MLSTKKGWESYAAEKRTKVAGPSLIVAKTRHGYEKTRAKDGKHGRGRVRMVARGRKIGVVVPSSVSQYKTPGRIETSRNREMGR